MTRCEVERRSDFSLLFLSLVLVRGGCEPIEEIEVSYSITLAVLDVRRRPEFFKERELPGETGASCSVLVIEWFTWRDLREEVDW